MRQVRRRGLPPRRGVVGIDPSRSALGIAVDGAGVGGEVSTIKAAPGALTGVKQLISLRDQTLAVVKQAQPELVVIEDYAYGAPYQAHQLGELGGVLRVALYEAEFRWVAVNLTHIKMYATGTGNAKKLKVVQAALKRLDLEAEDDNQSDAAWCRVIGYGLLGKPIIDLPQSHKRALEKVKFVA